MIHTAPSQWVQRMGDPLDPPKNGTLHTTMARTRSIGCLCDWQLCLTENIFWSNLCEYIKLNLNLNPEAVVGFWLFKRLSSNKINCGSTPRDKATILWKEMKRLNSTNPVKLFQRANVQRRGSFKNWVGRGEKKNLKKTYKLEGIGIWRLIAEVGPELELLRDAGSRSIRFD